MQGKEQFPLFSAQSSSSFMLTNQRCCSRLKQLLASFLLVDNRVKVIVTQLVVISNRALSLPPSIRNDMIERLGSTYNENRDRIVPFFTS